MQVVEKTIGIKERIEETWQEVVFVRHKKYAAGIDNDNKSMMW